MPSALIPVFRFLKVRGGQEWGKRAAFTGSVRIELNSRTFSWRWKTACWCGEASRMLELVPESLQVNHTTTLRYRSGEERTFRNNVLTGSHEAKDRTGHKHSD